MEFVANKSSGFSSMIEVNEEILRETNNDFE